MHAHLTRPRSLLCHSLLYMPVPRLKTTYTPWFRPALGPFCPSPRLPAPDPLQASGSAVYYVYAMYTPSMRDIAGKEERKAVNWGPVSLSSVPQLLGRRLAGLATAPPCARQNVAGGAQESTLDEVDFRLPHARMISVHHSPLLIYQGGPTRSRDSHGSMSLAPDGTAEIRT